MMKKVLFTICLLLSFKSAAAQYSVIDQRSTTKSNVEFLVANNGIYGHDLLKKRGGVFWPRGSGDMYIFGGGLWFGAKKDYNGKTRELAIMAYNPGSGHSWMIPGQQDDHLKLIDSTLYKVYVSSDFDNEGKAKNDVKFNWPIWNTKGNLKTNGNFGSYIYNVTDRSSNVYTKGATFISDEDIVTVYNDSDLEKYEGRNAKGSAALGFPFGIQFEQTLYSWRIGTSLQDIIAIRYTLINQSADTLKDCWVGPATDVDVVASGNKNNKAYSNDRNRYFFERPDLHTGIAWSEESEDDEGKNLGVLGISLIETPAIDEKSYLRKDKKSYDFREQLGLKTFYYHWGDPEFDDWYWLMSSARKDSNTGIGDKRIVSATGPFHMLPGDTTYLTVAFTFAKRDTANENYAELIQKIEAVRDTLFKNAGEEIPEANPENPFVIYNSPSEATLYLSLLKIGNVKIEIFNILGQRMSEVFKGELSAQNHAIPFSTALFPSGAYYCAIVTDSGVEMVPMRIAR